MAPVAPPCASARELKQKASMTRTAKVRSNDTKIEVKIDIKFLLSGRSGQRRHRRYSEKQPIRYAAIATVKMEPRRQFGAKRTAAAVVIRVGRCQKILWWRSRSSRIVDLYRRISPKAVTGLGTGKPLFIRRRSWSKKKKSRSHSSSFRKGPGQTSIPHSMSSSGVHGVASGVVLRVEIRNIDLSHRKNHWENRRSTGTR